ncbi:MAG: hypothetical protein IPL08_16660 [Saprospiraceae bacterium]|nr:hypothetical protein [Saprospiraceae bacterium]
MISNIQINFSNQTFLHLFPYTLSTDKPTLVFCDLIKHRGKPMLIQITHNHINTFLDLTSVFDVVLLYFDEKNEFIGASYSLDSGIGGTFVLLTQARKILLLPFSFDINLPRVKNIEISFPKNSN